MELTIKIKPSSQRFGEETIIKVRPMSTSPEHFSEAVEKVNVTAYLTFDLDWLLIPLAALANVRRPGLEVLMVSIIVPKAVIIATFDGNTPE